MEECLRPGIAQGNEDSRRLCAINKTEVGNMEIRKATRKKSKARVGISAPSGAGKTYGALLMSFGMGSKVGIIDTENGSADLYADLGDYDVISLSAPYDPAKYTEAMRAFERSGYDVIIIDSLSHAWSGTGGLLDKQGQIADKNGNSYTAWRAVTPQHNMLVDAMLQSPCHVIATMRAKQEYVQEKNNQGKTVVRKLGMSPVQRDGMEYEFTVFIEVDSSHMATATKDRTSLFDGKTFRLSRETGEILSQWLNVESPAKTAAIIQPPPTPHQASPQQRQVAQPQQATEEPPPPDAPIVDIDSDPKPALIARVRTLFVGVRKLKDEAVARDAVAKAIGSFPSRLDDLSIDSLMLAAEALGKIMGEK